MTVDAGAAMDRLFDLAVVVGDLMNQRLGEHGLTPARAEVIWLLHHHGQLTQRELSQSLKCTPRNVTGLIDALQTAGFVQRAPHPTDRRAILVTLTDPGKSLVTSWHADREQGAGELFATTSATELATFVTVLDRVLAGLRTNYDRPQ